MQLHIDQINPKLGIQWRRSGLRESEVSRYAAALKEGDLLPPIEVYSVDAQYILVDGFHRLEAHRRASMAIIEANITDGTMRDARRASFIANKQHDNAGIPRTNADKRIIAEAAADDYPEDEMSSRELGRLIGVSHNLIAEIRREQKRWASATRINVADVRTWFATRPLDPDWAHIIAAEIIDKKRRLEPIQVICDGADYWVIDGLHRLAAHRLAGISEIDAHIAHGAEWDILVARCKANAEWDKTGAPVKLTDRLRNYGRAKKHPFARHLSDADVMEHVGLSPYLMNCSHSRPAV